jgi:hypothetical protein
MIPGEAIPKFENMIYLPMIINVLERDRGSIEIGAFKLKGPYTNLIESALTAAKTELRETNKYARKNNMKVIKGKNDGTFTDYTFIVGGYEDKRRYLNIRLRNRTEELMSVYFSKVGN